MNGCKYFSCSAQSCTYYSGVNQSYWRLTRLNKSFRNGSKTTSPLSRDCLLMCQSPSPLSWHRFRSILLMLLVAARGGAFGLEQPGSSLMEHFERFRWLYRKLRVPWHFSGAKGCEGRGHSCWLDCFGSWFTEGQSVMKHASTELVQ